jgi:hypothetical protein
MSNIIKFPAPTAKAYQLICPECSGETFTIMTLENDGLNLSPASFACANEECDHSHMVLISWCDVIEPEEEE